MSPENAAIPLFKFSFLSFSKKKEAENDSSKLSELKKQLAETKLEIEAAEDLFNNVTDPKLIDTYIYKMQSEESRYEKILADIKKLM